MGAGGPEGDPGRHETGDERWRLRPRRVAGPPFNPTIQPMHPGEMSVSTRDPNDRVVHTVGGVKIRRRDIVKAGLTGASLAAVAGLPTQAQAQKAEFRFRMQSFLGPGTIEWDQLVPRYIQRISEMSHGPLHNHATPHTRQTSVRGKEKKVV